MTDHKLTIGRIVVAVDAAETSELALELARYLGDTVSLELLGLFVENAPLLEYSRSGLAREITHSGRERPLERDQLERQLRERSTQARSRFEQAAARLGLRHSFRVTRGEIAAELLAQTAEAEALVLSFGGRAAPPDPWIRAAAERLLSSRLPVLLIAREGWLRGRSIAVVVEDAVSPSAAFGAAAHLAKQSRSPLTVLLTGRALESREASAERVVAAARAHGAEVRDVLAVRSMTPGALTQAIRLCQARLLVLPAEETPEQAPRVVELLRRLPSALMIVRG